jgi:hypothetical protein
LPSLPHTSSLSSPFSLLNEEKENTKAEAKEGKKWLEKGRDWMKEIMIEREAMKKKLAKEAKKRGEEEGRRRMEEKEIERSKQDLQKEEEVTVCLREEKLELRKNLLE